MCWQVMVGICTIVTYQLLHKPLQFTMHVTHAGKVSYVRMMASTPALLDLT